MASQKEIDPTEVEVDDELPGLDEAAPEENDLDEDDEDGSEDDELEELEAALRAEYEDAADFIDTELAPVRELAQRYYARMPFGDEEEGRSSVVDGTVPDTIDGMRPSIMREFCSGKEVVRFRPRNRNQVRAALLATTYVNQVLDSHGNNRFLLIDSWTKDALLKRVGFVTWRWEKKVRVTEQRYEGLSPGQAILLAAEDDVEVLEQATDVEQNPAVQAALQDPTIPEHVKAQLQAQLDVTISMRIRRRYENGCLRVEAVPPEEVVFSRWARDEDNCTLFGRRRYVKASDLVALGVDKELVEENKGRDGQFGVNNEALLRFLNPRISSAASPDESQDEVFLFEGYLWFDGDDDGIAELHWVRAIGPNLVIVEREVVSDINWATITPNPEPHTIIGWSVADATMDLQEQKSAVLRATLDSLASSIFPSLVVVENAVEIDDALNTEMGRIIRAKAPGMVQSLAEPFIGPQALGVLDYLDNIRANRTGQSTASLGLDPETMQSTNRKAIDNTLSKSQERLEFICRAFAETGFKRLFRGILREIIRHQDKAVMIRVAGDWVEFDPRDWDADMDLEVEVGLGRGDDKEALEALGAIAQKQEQILLQLGPGNPLCGFDHYSNTLADMVKRAGFYDTTRYFNVVTPEAAQQFAQQAQQSQGQGDPTATLLAQVEVKKAETQQQTQLAKTELDRRKAMAEDDRERDRMEADILLKVAELRAKYGAQLDEAQIWAAIERDRNAQQVQSNERVQLHRNEIQGQVAQQRAALPPAQQGGQNGAV